MDQRKKAIGIFAIGLAFIITAVGAFISGYFIGKNTNVRVANIEENNKNTVENIVENTIENTTENSVANIIENTVEDNTKKVEEYSDKEIMSYKYKISYNPMSITEAIYTYDYEINFETNEITRDWKHSWLTSNNIKDSGNDTVKMDTTTQHELVEVLKKFDNNDLVYGKRNETFGTQQSVEINESTKEITYSFKEQDKYGLIKKLEDIFKK